MPIPIRTIVAGVSQPADDDPTLLAAAELARWTGATLHLVMAFTVPPVFTPLEPGYAFPQWVAQYSESLRARLQGAAARVAGAESAVCHAIAGPPAPAILETAAAQGADLLVVGAARPDRLGGAFLGTTAQRVLRGAAVPVLVTRRPLHRPLRRVLLATDASELGAAVHEEGLATAAAAFGEPAAIHALLVLWFPLLPPPLPREVMDRAALETLEAFLRARHPRPVPVEPVVRTGVPAEEIVAEAERWDADLLVVGTHARGWAARLALGSVAEAALRDARCNVLAVPPRAPSPRPAGDHAPAEQADPALARLTGVPG